MGDAVSLAEETESGSSPASRLLELIDQKVGSEAARAFAQAYLRRLSGDASEGIAAEQLLAEVVGAFEFASARGDEPMAVRAFNPTLAEHGYEPLGSVVETNTDDWPFLVDSVSAALESHKLEVARLLHPVIGVERDGDGRITAVGRARDAAHRESVMHFDLVRRLNDEQLEEVDHAVREALVAVRKVVTDFQAMTERVDDMVTVARAGTARYPRDEVHEVADFLEWLLKRQLRAAGRPRVRHLRAGHLRHPRLRPRNPARRGAVDVRDHRAARQAPGRRARARDERRPAAGRQDQRRLAGAQAGADGLRRRAPRVAIGRDRRRVAAARAVHVEGVRRARVGDAAAAPQAAPGARRRGPDRGLARLQGRRLALRLVPEGGAVRGAGRRPAPRGRRADRPRGHGQGAPARASRRRRPQRLDHPLAPAGALQRAARLAGHRAAEGALRDVRRRGAPRARRGRAGARALLRARRRGAAGDPHARPRGGGRRTRPHVGRRARRRARQGRPRAGPRPGPPASRTTTRATRSRSWRRSTSAASRASTPARSSWSASIRSATRGRPAWRSTSAAARSSSRARCRCSRTSACA